MRQEDDQILQPPDHCASLQEVRAAIDTLDRRLIATLGLRAAYVRAAGRFKATEAAVSAPDRLAAMLVDRRRWASEAELEPDLVERLFRDLVAYFTGQELAHWRAAHIHDGFAAEEGPAAAGA